MKQRLVGAIVLVALAVIFLPMLLDGSGRGGPVDIAIEIPAKPEPPANRLDDAADGTDFADTSLAGSAAARGETEPTRALSGDAAVADGGDDLADKAALARDSAAGEADPADAAEPPDAAMADGVPPDGAAAMGETGDRSAGPRAWVVQAGSFTRETNALVLRDRLQESGFDAFAERGEADERTVWRVRVGPVATRAEAEELGERLSDERGAAVLVMSHP